MSGDHLVHGLHGDLVEPDWPAISDEDVIASLTGYVELRGPLEVLWTSPRPLSSAAIVASGESVVLVKRHRSDVRSMSSLLVEHGYLAHARRRGAPTVDVLRDEAGHSVVEASGWVWEVHTLASGIDAYRDDQSWTPYHCLAHARAAGEALARWHLATSDHEAPQRGEPLLITRFSAFASIDPVETLGQYTDGRPALRAVLECHDWRADIRRTHLPWAERLQPHLSGLRPSWTHGDWHPSNLFWSTRNSDAVVTSVVDVGLSDRTTAVVDIATAVERTAIPWLDLGTERDVVPDLDTVEAILDGYESIRPMTTAEAAALPELLPIVQSEFALSEVDYFTSVLGDIQRAELAYKSFFLAHTDWFATEHGAALVEHLRNRSRRGARAS